jgi:inorganic triphosphatase YgiF
MAKPTTHVEIEAKYDVADGQPLPDLIGVGGVDAVVAQAEMVLTATYFDTPTHSLAAARATLRRRTGGTDDGWHLKLPLADGERLELHRSLGRGQSPPPSLTAPVRALVRADRLVTVATLVNRRTVHHLLDADGRLLAELADDTVTGARHDVDGDPVVWRELEIELVHGDRRVLAALDAAVRSGGLVPAAGPSKLARVLGGAPSPPASRGSAGRRTAVAEVLQGELRGGLQDLLGADPLVRLDRPGAAVRMRDAVTRLRAATALRHQVATDDRTAAIRSELTWLDSVVGEVGDLDASASRVRAALATEPGELVLGPVSRRVDREVAAARRGAQAAVREALVSARYLALLDSVTELAAGEPDAAALPGRAGDVLPELADRALHRVQRRLGRLRRASSEDERRRHVRAGLADVHRARLAGRLASEVRGARGTGFAALEEALGVLTELATGVRAQTLLRHLGVQAHLAGENGFTFGRLHGVEELHAARLLRRAKAARKKIKRMRRG